MRGMVFMMIFAIVLAGCSASSTSAKARPTVPELDLERYMGTWYEIARFDHRFERGLVGVTATYTLRSDGRIDVLNAGFEETLDGERSTANGVARMPDPEQPGRLQVSFFLWFWADYLILALDDQDYSWALVGSSSDDYLWFLSRTPEMQPDVWDMLVAKAESLGYDTQKLIIVQQPKGLHLKN